MKILMLDNYDSFTYNLVQYFGELGAQVEVHRNDEITVQGIAERRADRLVFSPGPSCPSNAGVMLEAIRAFAGQLPIFGVCLGHQAIGESFGGTVIRAQLQMHGKLSKITHDGRGVYQNLPEQFHVTRYHSLALEARSLPPVLGVTSRSEDGEIMGVRHLQMPASAPIEGVQFHPESIASEHGHALLKNFLTL